MVNRTCAVLQHQFCVPIFSWNQYHEIFVKLISRNDLLPCGTVVRYPKEKEALMLWPIAVSLEWIKSFLSSVSNVISPGYEGKRVISWNQLHWHYYLNWLSPQFIVILNVVPFPRVFWKKSNWCYVLSFVKP